MKNKRKTLLKDDAQSIDPKHDFLQIEVDSRPVFEKDFIFIRFSRASAFFYEIVRQQHANAFGEGLKLANNGLDGVKSFTNTFFEISRAGYFISFAGINAMGTIGQNNNIKKLINEFVSNPHNPSLNLLIDSKKPEIIDYLNNCKASDVLFEGLAQKNNDMIYDGVNALYSKLTEDGNNQIQTSETSADTDQDLRILFRKLPLELCDFYSFKNKIENIENIDVYSYKYRKCETDKEINKAVECFSKCGIDLLMLAHATEAVGAMANRFLRDKRSTDSKFPELTIIKRESENLDASNAVCEASFAEEIMEYADCELEKAKAIFLWLLEVARYKPFVFPKVNMKFLGNKKIMQLRPPEFSSMDLIESWRYTQQSHDDYQGF